MARVGAAPEQAHRPGQLFTARTPRVVAAAKLARRRERDAAGRFLVEGPQAVREALAIPGLAVEVFATPAAMSRHPDLTGSAAAARVPVSAVAEAGLAALADTRTPQGIVVVCRYLDVPLDRVLGSSSPGSSSPGSSGSSRSGSSSPGSSDPARLIAVCAGISDPGNAGTVLRTADAAGAGAVVFAGDAVDPYNGKCVRASAGSLFHVDVVRGGDPYRVVTALRGAGLRVLAADPYGAADLDDLADAGELARPTAWLFGSEAHGLAGDLAAAADIRVRVPIHGRAESLNLAAAAAVCLYASAKALRGG